jgi:nucleoid DNA-binding protein
VGSNGTPPVGSRVGVEARKEPMGVFGGKLYMDQKETIAELASKANLTLREAEIVVRAAYDVIVQTVRRGKSYQIRGFGYFFTRSRRSRSRNRTAQWDAQSKRVYFRAADELKSFVNRSKRDESETRRGLEG